MILIYHMTGASQVVPLYMQMRVLGLQLSLPHRIWPPVSLLEWRHRQFLSSIPSKTIEFVIPPAQNWWNIYCGLNRFYSGWIWWQWWFVCSWITLISRIIFSHWSHWSHFGTSLFTLSWPFRRKSVPPFAMPILVAYLYIIVKLRCWLPSHVRGHWIIRESLKHVRERDSLCCCC